MKSDIMPIKSDKAIEPMRRNKGKPAVTLGRKASGPGLGAKIAELLDAMWRDVPSARPIREHS